MAIYYPSGCDTLVGEHLCDPCEAKEKGRVRSVAFIKSTFAFSDPSSPTEWQTGINAGDIIVIPQVLGSFDGGSEVESAGYGDQSTNLTGFNFTSNFKDPNYKNNATFYNALKYSRDYVYAFRTETQTHISDNTVSVIPKNPMTENLTDDVVWDVTVKWAGPDLPAPQDTPPGIFECFSVAS
jgi:hypothetical protein